MMDFLKKLLFFSGSLVVIFTVIFISSIVLSNKVQTSNSKTETQSITNSTGNEQSTTQGYSKETFPEIKINDETENNTYSDSNATETVKVERVVDGDTFIYIDNLGLEKRLRLIGVDTPESVNAIDSKNCKYGKTASQYTTKLLTGKTVDLEYDTTKKDMYQRDLAYVYLDGVMVNYDLVAKGYAVAKEYPPNTKYAELFKSAQIDAEKNCVGMWNNKVSNKDCNLKEENYIEY